MKIKIVSIGLLIVLSFLVLPTFVKAQVDITAPDLEALTQSLRQQIKALEKRVVQLQEELIVQLEEKLKEMTEEPKEAEKAVIEALEERITQLREELLKEEAPPEEESEEEPAEEEAPPKKELIEVSGGGGGGGTICHNECSSSGLKRCSGNGYQTCGDYDADYCLEWDPITDCPTNTVCQNGICIQQKCSDETLYGQCSTDKPKYCDNGDLVDKCSTCGCSSGQECQVDGSCVVSIECTSGPCCDISTKTLRSTAYICQENVTTEYGCPWGSDSGDDVGVRHQDRYCSGSSADCDGVLQWNDWGISDDCASNEACVDSSCVLLTCSDETLYGQCSTNKPKYCDNGDLIDTCLTCGCPSGEECQVNGVCTPPGVEVYDVSVRAAGYINVLIPPDASGLNMELLGTSGEIDVTDFWYNGTFNLRPYKFAQAFAEFEGICSSAEINVRVWVERDSVSYLPCEADILADKIIERLISYSASGNIMPLSSFGNIENAGSSQWKGYPVLSVNKQPGHQLPAEPNVDYVVITSDEMKSLTDDFINWKQTQGFETFVTTTQGINNIYNGSSLELKTREFLKDAFNAWQMEYVLIVGGADTLPPISYQVFDSPHPLGPTENRVADYYYTTLEQATSSFSFTYPRCSSLDFPDFILGRFPSDNPEEIQNMAQKTISYEATTSPGEWVRTNLLVHGDNASSDNDWNATDDRPKLKLVYPGDLTLQALIDLFNQGVGSVTMNAHSNSSGWLLGGGDWFNYATVDGLSNSKLPVIFSGGCHCAKFTNSNSIAVKLLGMPNSGAVAMVGGTSYTPYGMRVLRSAYNCWGSCSVDCWRIPDANYHVGKAFFYFITLNNVEYMILLGDPSLILATANYDL